MAALYGHRWTSNYGTRDDGDTWLHALRGVTPGQLADGIRSCVNRAAERRRVGDEDWPPTAGEFRAMCEEPVVASGMARDRRAQRLFRRALPAPPPDPAVVERELSRMKGLLS